jgi:hypothetical protein
MEQQQSFKNNILNISNVLIVGGIALILLTINIFTENGLLGASFGYISIICAIILLMIMSFVEISKSQLQNQLDLKSTLISLFSLFSPYLLLLIILICSVLMINVYFDKLTKIELPQSFRSFTIISIVFIVIQCCLFLYNAFKSDPTKINSIEIAKLRFLGIINLIVLFTSFISLRYFTTDG